jgi:hypothetical protein
MTTKVGNDPTAGGEGAGEGQGADPTAQGGEGAGEGQGADPTAGEGEGGEGEGAGEEPETKSAAAPDNNAALAAAIDKLRESLAPGRTPMTPEQQEAMWQKLENDSGMTRQQLQWQEQHTRRAAVLANLDTNKELGKMKAEKILSDADPTLLAEVEKSMALLDPMLQGSPKAWEDAAYLVLGRSAKMTKKTGQGDGGTGGTKRTIVGGGAPTTRGAAMGKPAPKAKEYSAMEQMLITREFGGKPEEYEKYKAGKTIGSDSRIVAGQSGGAADKELERLTANNT